MFQCGFITTLDMTCLEYVRGTMKSQDNQGILKCSVLPGVGIYSFATPSTGCLESAWRQMK